MILVCFAVKEEAAPLKEVAGSLPQVQMLVTGMGAKNAESAIRKAILDAKPDIVFTCGFAGALRPGLESGEVLFETQAKTPVEASLLAADARRGTFHCASKLATTIAEKRALRETTSADAVEMESAIVSAVCREQGIQCAIVRVILDTAEEDLPLDFNSLMNERQEMSYGKLAVALAKSPGKISALKRLHAQSKVAAERLAQVLVSTLKRMQQTT